jgi:GAF domain-containing protein
MTSLPPDVETDLREENARLRAELRAALARQTATADILKVIASSPSDVQPVFDAIAERSKKLVDALSTTVFRLEDGMMHLRAFTPTNPDADATLRATFPAPLSKFSWGESIRRGEIYRVIDTEHEPEGLRDLARLRGWRSCLCVPLLRDGKPIGMIGPTRAEPGPFTDHHVQLLQTFADQAVIAIENARLFNETKEALERQTATADILKVIASSPSDTQPVFDAIAESANRLLGGFSSTVFLFIDGMAHLKAFTPTTPEADQVLTSSFPRQVADVVPFRMTEAGEVVQVPDTEAPTYQLKEIARARGYRSMLWVPLMNKGTSIGFIAVTRVQPGGFVDHHVQLLQTFADQAVIAIENARLFNETREALERQTATADILKVIASSPSDVQPVFKAIATSAKGLIGGFSATVTRFVGDTLHLVAFTPTNARADEALQASFPMPLAGLSAFELVRGGETVQFTDTESEGVPPLNREMARLRGYRSMVFTPLMSNGTPIGMISVTRKEPGSFGAHYVQLLQTFADQAVIAIENVRLFDEVQARTRDLSEALQQQTATADVLKVISRSAFDLDAVMNTLTHSAAELCKAELSALYLREGDVLIARGLAGVDGTRMDFLRETPLRIDNSIAGRALQAGSILNIGEVERDGTETTKKFGETLGFKSILFVPLMREGRGIGVFALGRKRTGQYSRREIDLVQTFADQAVIAIENVRLFDEVQARTRELSQSLDELRTAQDRLIQTEKLASLGQLTAGIAHEIKNPLNFVNNFAALSAELTDELNDALKPVPLAGTTREEVDELTRMLKDNLEKVVQHGKRADSIVKNMLLHSREGTGEHRPADINALLDESLNLAYHGARAEKPQFNVTLRRDFDENAGTIEVFPQEITRVFLNLISNGFYAVTKRKMEVGNSGFEPTLSATTRNLDHAVEIRIRDNGTGIPTAVKEKMFNPFYTTKPAGEGTGLGLSMSHDIVVKQHGGTIEVDTELGRYTEFRIVLPRASHQSSQKRGQT